MRVLITGSRGFIGKNLAVRLKELKKFEVLEFHHEMSAEDLDMLMPQVDFVFHLAGVNRPQHESEFTEGNTDLTAKVCRAIKATGKKIPIVYTSSIQAEKENAYGLSKKEAEQALLQEIAAKDLFIYRLPNVFGKWSKPNYNSAVATFCNNIANGLPIKINDPDAEVNLVYIDDVVASFVNKLEGFALGQSDDRVFQDVEPVYQLTVGQLAEKIENFKNSRSSLITEHVGAGLDRALHATYLSFLKPEQFSYSLTRHEDPRGVFVEMLKTKESGQFSFFTAGIGVTRGGHYHHSKTEKFLILKGKGRYRFRNIVTKEFYELDVDATESKVVETIPGWSHDISNIGNEELVVMLWANEIFDRSKPDTIAHEV